MNILFFTHYSEMYGANKSLIDLIQGLEHHGVRATVVLPRPGPVCEVLDTCNIPYVIQNFKDWVRLPLKHRGKLKKIALFLKKIRARWMTYRYNSKSIISLRTQIKSKQFDLIYSNSSVFNFGFIYARKYNIPHAWHFREVQEHYGIQWVYSKQYVNRSFKRSKIKFSISQYVKNNYKIKNKVSDIIVENDSVLSTSKLASLDAERHKKSSLKSNVITFGMVALVHPNKGQIEAVEALAVVAKRYPNVRLLLAGGGHTETLNEVISRLNLKEKVVLLGQLPDPYEAFLEMDIYLMCSKKEGLGRVTLEAMACALPIIGYKEGGTAEVIVDSVNGIFYHTDYQELAIKMMYLIENVEVRKKMGQNGRKIFEKKYTNEVYADKMFSHITKYIS